MSGRGREWIGDSDANTEAWESPVDDMAPGACEVRTVSESVASAVESLILHLHGNGKVDLTREEWALFRVVAGQLIDEAVERRVAGLQQEPRP